MSLQVGFGGFGVCQLPCNRMSTFVLVPGLAWHVSFEPNNAVREKATFHVHGLMSLVRHRANIIPVLPFVKQPIQPRRRERTSLHYPKASS